MHFLIDGYNVIFALRALLEEHAVAFDPNAERDRLLGLLSRYRRRNPIEMHVVFDGGRTDYSSVLTRREQGIVVSYTTQGETADDFIKDVVRHSHSPKSIVLVTADRDILRTAKRRKAKMVPSQEFAMHVMEEVHKKRRPEIPEKYTGLTAPADVDYWMRVFGFSDDDDTPSGS